MEDYNNTATEKLATTEMEAIKEDLRSLKSNVKSLKSSAGTLAQDLRTGGGAVAREGIDQLKATGESEFHKIEAYVKEKPGQSLAMAFAAGIIVNFLLGVRR